MIFLGPLTMCRNWWRRSMLKPVFSGQFKRDYKLALKRGCDPKKLESVIIMLCQEQPLPSTCRDHALVNSRQYKNVRECHIEPAWLLIYRIEKRPAYFAITSHRFSKWFILKTDGSLILMRTVRFFREKQLFLQSFFIFLTLFSCVNREGDAEVCAADQETCQQELNCPQKVRQRLRRINMQSD